MIRSSEKIDRDEFLLKVREALGKKSTLTDKTAIMKYFSTSQEELNIRAQEIKDRCQANKETLAIKLEEQAIKAKWNVTRVGSIQKACQYVTKIVNEKKAKLLLYSHYPILEKMDLDNYMSNTDVVLKRDSLPDAFEFSEKEVARHRKKEEAFSSDIGLTGVDYAIAETGTCVLIPQHGISRLVSLVPPVHVAFVGLDQIVETADDVFTLRRLELFQKGDIGSYMNFISGPSRTADIEQTITIGVHGPKEAHMVIVD